ncbi:hypothetical protein LF916_00465 [Bifidobacterium pseudolongum]|uniref:hypothetical protein n=1 Tax=Bifidobacterium pseudolongum TaxID=1694 RepID=UPI001F0CE90D|nr:hypothetical protein [Bifidobacterium pseudolongum]MCH4859376.1 hypothetical protein [Bifidobacterium pseudolongum]MCH4861147.1 hypothetical protein [Bifidobacterium pseudolongum]
MTAKKTDVPDPSAKQIAYSRTAAAYLAVNLLNTAADALMHGHDMRPPRLPRTNPCDDAVTARSLQIIAATLTDYIHANTTDEQEDGVPPQPDHAERRQKEQE